MQNIVEIIILFAVFPIITTKYVCQLSEKTLYLSVFEFSSLRAPYFLEGRYSFVFVRTVGSSVY